MKLLFKLIVFLVLVIAGGSVVVFGLGVINKPRDLSIKPDSVDLTSAYEKTGIKFTRLPLSNNPRNTLKFSGKTEFNKDLTDEEVTAMLNNDKWIYNFIPDTQIRFNSNRTIEFAGRLHTDRLKGYFEAHKVPQGAVKPLLDILTKIPFAPSYYVRTGAKIDRNNLSLDIKDVEIGGVGALSAVASRNNQVIADFIENYIFNTVQNLDIRHLEIGDGKMKVDTTFPEEVSVSY